MARPHPAAVGANGRATRCLFVNAEDRAQTEAAILTAIATLAAGVDGLDRILGTAFTHLRQLIPFTGGSIGLVDGDELVLCAAAGPFTDTALGQRRRRGDNALWRVVETGEPFACPDLLAAGYAPSSPVRAYMAVPLSWQGRRFGVLEVDALEPAAFGDDDLALLTRVGPVLSGPIELARRRAAELDAVASAETAERRLRELVQQVDAILWEVEWPSRRYTFVSQGAEAVLGYPIARWMAEASFREAIAHPDDREDRVAEVRSVLQGGTEGQMEIESRAVRADGRVVWLRDIVQIVRHEDGRPRQLRGLTIDVTHRHEIEEALRASDEFSRQVIASASQGVIVYDRELRYRVWNPFMERLTGLGAADVLGRRAFDLFPHLEQSGVHALLQAALGGETVVSPETHYTVPETGRSGWVIGSYAPLHDAGGATIGVIGSVTDVSARREATEALRRSEERFRSLVQNASDVICVLGSDGTVSYLSPSVERMLGHSPESLAGTSLARLIHPDDLPGWALFRGQLLAGVDYLGKHELRVRHSNGHWRQLEITASNQLGNASVGGVVLNAHDITERKAVEAELERRALSDPLTGLPNRSFFSARLLHALSTAARAHTGVAVLFLDLDQFKAVNDSFGHSAGDQLLVAVGQRLQSCLRASDTVARLGGDEFVVLLEIIEIPTDAIRAAERILEALGVPFTVSGHDLVISTSIGIAVSEAGTEAGPDALVHNADLALYRAKAEGRARFALFEKDMLRAGREIRLPFLPDATQRRDDDANGGQEAKASS